jgi:hypothetical protein
MLPFYEISIGVFSILVYTILITPYYDTKTLHKQTKHIVSILKTKFVDPTKSDHYYERGRHAFQLCQTLHDIIHFENKYIMIYGVPVHNFVSKELTTLNEEYRDKIYNPVNFPYTHRNRICIRFTNQSANYIYRFVCKDYYAEQHSPIPAYLLCGFMAIAMTYRFFWRADIDR